MGEEVKPWNRNQMTFHMEVPYHLLPPEHQARVRAENEAFRRQQRRLVVRLRRLRRVVRGRVCDTWTVLRHGLPDDRW